MRAQPIRYKGVLAMPGSELHKHLTEGNVKKAEQVHQDADRRYLQLVGEESAKHMAQIQRDWDNRNKRNLSNGNEEA